MQKLTVPIAKALANQAIARIRDIYKESEKKLKDSYKESKEWKAYLKANDVVQKAIKERGVYEQKFKDAFNTKMSYVSSVYGYADRESYASISGRSTNIDADELKDRILVEHFTSAAGETSTQIIDRMVDEYTK